MKRTRKWTFVQQEATRLTSLGLSASEIARRLEVNKSTVSRWLSGGKLTRRAKRPARPPRRFVPVAVKIRQTPEQWAAAVRSEYKLDSTDEQLVTLGQSALALSLDSHVAPQVRMVATGRFQAIVKQLALVARHEAEAEPVAPPAGPPTRVPDRQVVRPSVDPRKVLMAVK